MIRHIALIKYPDPDRAGFKEEVEALLRPFAAGIPGLRDFHWGWDVSGRSRGYTLGLVMAFDDSEQLKAYTPHPVHQAFVQWNARQGGEVLAFDFPFDNL